MLYIINNIIKIIFWGQKLEKRRRLKHKKYKSDNK